MYIGVGLATVVGIALTSSLLLLGILTYSGGDSLGTSSPSKLFGRGEDGVSLGFKTFLIWHKISPFPPLSSPWATTQL